MTDTFTPVTAAVVSTLEAKGLRPSVTGVYRGGVEVNFSGEGVDSPFGVIVVGQRTGRILRGTITHGNSNVHTPERYKGAVEVRRAIRETL